ncbi:MAG: tetratricopeptide repeat protein [Acidobacteriota bacterium]
MGWTRIEELFLHVVGLPVEERATFLDRACSEAPELRRQVEELLAADQSAGSFLEPPVAAPVVGSNRLVGQSIGRYRILRYLGQGGMATVYVGARDRDYEQEVAIKIFDHDQRRRDLVRRFEHERQILAGLEHPYIARLLDGGSTAEGLPFLVMELIDGEPIDVYCDHHRLSIDARLELFRRLCEAVSHAHRNLVVHRDIKPRNILVTADGVPKLLDFGIAKLMEDDENLTVVGSRLMTPAYASPEQVLGQPVTTGSDVYALGVLLYRLLCGVSPYPPSDDTADLERLIVESDPVVPSQRLTVLPSENRADVATHRDTEPGELRRRLTGDLDEIVRAALRKDPLDRYRSVADLEEDLRRYQEGLPVRARAATPSYQLRKFIVRHRLAVAAVMAFLLIGIAFTVSVTLLARQVTVERDEARQERDNAEQVASFLRDMFAEADPDRAKGELTVDQLLSRAAKQLETLHDQPEVYVTLASTLGDVYVERNFHEEADTLLTEAIRVGRQSLPPDHRALGEVLPVQAELEAFRGDLHKAEALLREALVINEAYGGEPLARTLNFLAMVAGMQGRYDESEPLFLRALEIERERLGPDAPVIGSYIGNLGMLTYSRGDLRSAADYYAEALRIHNNADPEHTAVGSFSINLGVIELEWGQLDRAEANLRRAVRLSEKRLGAHTWRTNAARAALGSVLAEQGDLEAARQHFATAIGHMQHELGDAHPRLAQAMSREGAMLLDQGAVDDAKDRFETALAIDREALGDSHPSTGHRLLLLGRLLGTTGDLDGAESHLREALRIYRDAFDDGHFRVGDIVVALGGVLTIRGELTEAEAHLREGLALLDNHFPADSPRLAMARAELAACLIERGELDEAEALLHGSLQWLEGQPGPEIRVETVRARLDRIESLRNV